MDVKDVQEAICECLEHAVQRYAREQMKIQKRLSMTDTPDCDMADTPNCY